MRRVAIVESVTYKQIDGRNVKFDAGMEFDVKAQYTDVDGEEMLVIQQDGAMPVAIEKMDVVEIGARGVHLQ